jgi:glycosyltransferase involved in cell wall biosynthesis
MRVTGSLYCSELSDPPDSRFNTRVRIAQILLPGASEYERKSQRIDQSALAERHEVIVSSLDTIRDANADVAHVYASVELPAAAFVGFPIPYVSPIGFRPTRWRLRRPLPPRRIVSPLGEEALPESVEERYFAMASAASRTRDSDVKIVASFDRPSVRNTVEQTLARVHRFRTDVEWQIHSAPPTPEDLTNVDAWVDPAVDENDFDGWVAEALVIGLPVVAARTPINVGRLEQGRTGMLAPPRDPNELTHAILAALFKTEVAESRQLAARQTVSKFRPRQRLRILERIYESVKNAAKTTIS